MDDYVWAVTLVWILILTGTVGFGTWLLVCRIWNQDPRPTPESPTRWQKFWQVENRVWIFLLGACIIACCMGFSFHGRGILDPPPADVLCGTMASEPGTPIVSNVWDPVAKKFVRPGCEPVQIAAWRAFFTPPRTHWWLGWALILLGILLATAFHTWNDEIQRAISNARERMAAGRSHTATRGGFLGAAERATESLQGGAASGGGAAAQGGQTGQHIGEGGILSRVIVIEILSEILQGMFRRNR